MKVLDEQPESLEGIFEVDAFLSWLAVKALMVVLDSYGGTIQHNFYLYEHPKTGRFTLVPWDLNGAFAGFDCTDLDGELVALPIDAPHCPNGDPWLIERVLAIPRHRATYHAKLRALLDDPFRMDRVQAAIDRLANRVEPHVAVDSSAFYGISSECGVVDRGQGSNASANQGASAVDERPGLAAFLEARTAWLCAELEPSWQGDVPPARCTEANTGCGDGICVSGEEVPGATFCDDCLCEPCFKLLAGSGCVPICNAEYCAECPDGWTCESGLGLCRPQGRSCPGRLRAGPLSRM